MKTWYASAACTTSRRISLRARPATCASALRSRRGLCASTPTRWKPDSAARRFRTSSARCSGTSAWRRASSRPTGGATWRTSTGCVVLVPPGWNRHSRYSGSSPMSTRCPKATAGTLSVARTSRRRKEGFFFLSSPPEAEWTCSVQWGEPSEESRIQPVLKPKEADDVTKLLSARGSASADVMKTMRVTIEPERDMDTPAWSPLSGKKRNLEESDISLLQAVFKTPWHCKRSWSTGSGTWQQSLALAGRN